MKERIKKFWAKAKKTASCWLWRRANNGIGYGVVRWGHPMRLAHRIAWEIKNGPIPKGMCVLHRCDNPSCVNPKHLYLGTHADNMRDIALRERNSTMKISNADVNRIRAAMREGANAGELARKFSVHNDTINGIARGVKRRSVPAIPH